ncbi:hypothetical protein BP6252_10871 [Coleophoma cylindrospora]|uniref:Enoyl reductase (ER) domain-containing protein n=1 Tax=Coleophoma cylindrospora TaxID=1849047 RepID=A0A3D8QNC4_9HELO|nr:hypothetical protein BP6252_10871 [Coleophoma cylindrospora]
MATTMKGWQYAAAVTTHLEKCIVLDESIPAPTKSSLARGQLLVEVIMAAINPIDYKLPESGRLGAIMMSPPAIPGLDFCGRIVGLHSSVTHLKEGQLIFGAHAQAARYGTLGQLIVIPSGQCALLPAGVKISDAAAIGTAAITAYQSYPPDRVKPGSKVFINGGSGGTGTFGIQFAKAMGAEVTVSCSTANIQLCKSLGADEVIDYKTTDILVELQKKGPVFDLAVDNAAVPASLYENSPTFLKPEGRFMQVSMDLSFRSLGGAFTRSLRPSFLGGVPRSYTFVRNVSNTKDFTQIGKWMAEGKVRAVIDEVFELEDAPKAFEKLRQGHSRGKILVRVGKE